MSEDARKKLVESGYDRMAEAYLSGKDPDDPATIAALEDLAGRIPPDAFILDLGCGAGVPATRWLSERYSVVGVDISEKQIELAKENAPNADFIKADMASLDFEDETFDAVVAFVSIIHVPRGEHMDVLEKIHGWLTPGGHFLASLSVGAWEGGDENWEGWGAAMCWSHYDAEQNLRMLREIGFSIVSAKAETGKGTGDEQETWLWAMAKK